MKILNSAGDTLAVFVKFDNKELPRFNTINANSELTILGKIDTDFLIGLYSLDSHKNITIKYLTDSYSIEDKNGFIVEELKPDKLLGPFIKILNTSNFSWKKLQKQNRYFYSALFIIFKLYNSLIFLYFLFFLIK